MFSHDQDKCLIYLKKMQVPIFFKIGITNIFLMTIFPNILLFFVDFSKTLFTSTVSNAGQ